MDLMNLFKRNQGNTQENRSVDCTCNPCNYYSDGLLFGQFMNQCQAQNLSVVFRCVDLISDSIANLPIEVKKIDDKHGDVLEEHPITYLFDDKDNVISTRRMLKLLMRDVLLKGNGFCYIERENNIPKRLRYLEPKDVQVVFDKFRYKVSYQVPLLMKNKLVDANDMLHFFKLSYNGFEGVSVLTYASRSIDIANQTESTAKQYFANGGMLSGIITVNSNLSEQQRKQIRESWNNTYGAGASGGVAVLQGNMTYQQLSSNAADSQMLESRNYAVKDIARFFGISPILLGESDGSSYKQLESVQQDFLTNTLQPYINMFEDEFNKKLTKPFDKTVEVNLDETAILKTDKTATAQYYNSMLTTGVLCIDEVRKELGYEKIGLTDHIIPFTDTSMNKLGNDTNENKSKSKK